jgi:hypothetical protein
MPRMTQAAVNAYEARQRQHANGLATDAAVEKEADLHNEILAECRRRGWIAVHSRMDLPTTTSVGTADFIIFIDGGKTLAVECKAKSGKLSMEQLSTSAWLSKLGHTLHIVRSFPEFLSICQPVSRA